MSMPPVGVSLMQVTEILMVRVALPSWLATVKLSVSV
jgi:hypothetical protein